MPLEDLVLARKEPANEHPLQEFNAYASGAPLPQIGRTRSLIVGAGAG
jgi:hypothetical protein